MMNDAFPSKGGRVNYNTYTVLCQLDVVNHTEFPSQGVDLIILNNSFQHQSMTKVKEVFQLIVLTLVPQSQDVMYFKYNTDLIMDLKGKILY